MFARELRAAVEQHKIIAVLVVDDAEVAVPLAEALLAGGVRIMELTLRTEAALDALGRIVTGVPEMTAGVGTILTPEQVRRAHGAGAAFGVAPGVNPRVLEAAREAGWSFAPGVVTPSDIEQALEFDCRLLKFFPAEPAGGLKYLQSMAAPYAHLKLGYVPLGGVSPANLGAYIGDPLITAVGGSWLAPRDVIARKDWAVITQNAREACRIIESV